MADDEKSVDAYKMNFGAVAICRVVAGFLSAPGVPVLLAYTILYAQGHYEAAESFPEMLAFLTYPAAILLGLPTFLILCEKRLYSLGSYLIAGILIGMTCYLIPAVFYLLFANFAWLVLKNTIGIIHIPLGCGLTASAAFWLIAIYSGNAQTESEST